MITHSQIQKLDILGYTMLPGSEPPVFYGGGFSCGGHFFEISESQALKQLEQAENMNKIYLEKFGKKMYNI